MTCKYTSNDSQMFPTEAHGKACESLVRALEEHLCLSAARCRLPEITMFRRTVCMLFASDSGNEEQSSDEDNQPKAMSAALKRRLAKV